MLFWGQGGHEWWPGRSRGTNLAVGLAGGWGIFELIHVDPGLGEVKIIFDDLIAAFVQSLLAIVVWWPVWLVHRQEECPVG